MNPPEQLTEGELRIAIAMERQWWFRANWYRASRASLVACLWRLAYCRAQLRNDETTGRVPNPYALARRGRRQDWPPAVHAVNLLFTKFPGRDPEPERGGRTR